MAVGHVSGWDRSAASAWHADGPDHHMMTEQDVAGSHIVFKPVRSWAGPSLMRSICETLRLEMRCASMGGRQRSGARRAQDYNYVPGWADTTNHRYKGGEKGEWKAKTELFKRLGAQSPHAPCTLQHLSEADGNIIVNQYRSRERKTNSATAFRVAQQQVNAHHRRLRAQGRC